MVNENLILHVERNKKSYEHVLVTAYKNSTDEEAHVITLGNLPDNTISRFSKHWKQSNINVWRVLCMEQ